MSSNGSESETVWKCTGLVLTTYFVCPIVRANMSSHSGQIFTGECVSAEYYHDAQLNEFLEKNHAALVYKLHPIEQTAFKGRRFSVNERCFELTDNMLFDADVRYTEILNAFDVMISDYSSIVFDYLLLAGRLFILYRTMRNSISQRGFVFRNIDSYMPGDKAFDFRQMLDAAKGI
ncbi:MAG: CDP-glycerol glycerophosphotransferase family protein [Enterocloster clostridioformis]